MSSTTLSKEKLAELVKCVLCMKTFTSPQTMKCLHTFCKHCLENHAKRSSVDDVQGLECPRCKQFTAQSDVTACTRTEHLLSLYARSTKRKMCFQCETESADWKCKKCAEFYCNSCKEMHVTIKQFKDHQFVRLGDLSDEIFLPRSLSCAKHGAKELEYFCFDCDVLLCSRCLLEGHDGHKRDTVHNAVDHVKSKVNKKLEAVKHITNERFLRAEKLKDTRLLIQTYADESFDAIKYRYKFLKQKLENDYHSLTRELKTSVDVEFEKVNAAIVAEEVKQSHAAAVTSYVENTLLTTAGALNVRESIKELIPAMTQFCTANDVEPLVTSNTCIFRYQIAEPLVDGENLIGKIDAIPTGFHSRYQPLIMKTKLESATVGKTIDIDSELNTGCYRMNIGFGKIVVCFWSSSVIVIYNMDGEKCLELNLRRKLCVTRSAVFVNNTDLVVASGDWLALVNTTTSKVQLLHDRSFYCDVLYVNQQICALTFEGRVDILELHQGNFKWEKCRQIKLARVKLCVGYPIAMTPIRIFLGVDGNKVLQFSLSGELLQTVTVNVHGPERTPNLCAVDADGRMLLSVGGQLVLQHNDQSQVVKLQGLTRCLDIGFEDQFTFWVLEEISADSGKYKLTKYSM